MLKIYALKSTFFKVLKKKLTLFYESLYFFGTHFTCLLITNFNINHIKK